jgi:F-type H+-transporting ATPase subunit epsilon
MSLHVQIVSAENALFDDTADFVSLPAANGEIGVLAGHTPVISTLKSGKIRIEKNGTIEEIWVAGGVIEVQPNKVIVLSDTAMRAKDVDEARVLEAKANAEQKLANKDNNFNIAKAEAELALAVAQLSALRQLKVKH